MTPLSIKRNATILIVTEFVTRLLLFYVVLQLINILGKATYGQLAYVFAIANLFVVLADFGIHTYATRLLAQSSAAWLQQRRAIVTLKVLGSAAAWILTVLIVHWTSTLDLPTILFGSLAIVLVSGRMFSEAIARGLQQMQLEGYSKIIHGVVQGLALLLALQVHGSLLTIALVYAASASVGWLVSIWLIRGQFFAKSATHTALKTLWPSVLPFATSIAINAQFNYFDSAVIGWFHDKSEVAVYAAAYKPIFFLTAVGGLIITAFFPKIAALWKDGQKAEARKLIKQLLLLTLLLGFGAAVLGTLFSGLVIDLLYSSEYVTAVGPFVVLLWSTLCIFFWAPLGNSLQACGYEKYYTHNFIIASVLNIPLTLMFVAFYGILGAALATVLTQLCLCLLMARDARRLLF